MFHLLTVHWRTDRWIDIQLEYLHRHLSGATRTYACLDEVPGNHHTKFDWVSTESIGSHSAKLNRLADVALEQSQDDDDVLIFLDGDAFPISELRSYVNEKLQTYSLLAIKRTENLGDPQPHPSFAATTVGFWKAIQGDWSSGHRWTTADGRRKTDVGGNLLKSLLERAIDWYPLLRTDSIGTDPLLFGVYDRVVYHHGGGFRKSVGHVQLAEAGLLERRWLRLLSKAPRFHPFQKRIRALEDANESAKETVYRELLSNPAFLDSYSR